MKLKDIIIQYREEHDMTMQVFADKCGLSKGYVSMLESGLRPQTKQEIKPSLSTYKKIAAGMGISLDDLLRKVDGDENVQVGGKGRQLSLAHSFDIQLFAEDPAQVSRDEALLEAFRELPPQVQEIVIAQTRGLLYSKRGQGSL